MDNLAGFAPILLYIVLPVITGLLAHRKGYNFFLWLLAAGVIGLIILAFLPFANREGATAEENASRRKTGNIIGAVISAVALLMLLLRLAAG